MRRLTPTLIASLLALALVAPAADGQTTAADYASEANAICKQTAKKGRKALKRIDTGNPTQDRIKQSALFAKLLGSTAKRLSELEPPPEIEEPAASWISSIRKQKRLIERSIRAVKKGKNATAIRLAERSAKVGAESVAKAKQLGATACGG